MPTAQKQIELAVRIDGKPGELGKVLRIVAEEGVNVLAYCSYADPNGVIVLLVVEDPGIAKRALEGAGFRCRANSVIVVGAADRVGAAASLGVFLGEAGIDILYSYASSSGQNNFVAVFKTADDEGAIRVLQGALTRAANAA